MGLFKKKKKEEEPGIGGNKVHVIIKKKIGESLITTIAEFDAIQKQDENYTFKLVNEKLNFKEDYSFETDTAIALLEAKLSDKKTDVALKEIDDWIKDQTGRINLIYQGYLFKDKESLQKYIKAKTDEDRDAITKEKANIIDEKNRLNLYQSLKFYYENKGKYTSYEELTKDGVRQITFLAKEGILIPFAINVADANMYSDVSTKKKIYYEKDYDIEKRYLESMSGGAGKIIFTIGFVVLGVLIISGLFFVIRSHEKYQQASAFLEQSWVSDMVEKSRLTTVNCGYYYSQLLRLGYLNKSYVEPEFQEENKKTGNQAVDFVSNILN